jgi:hypothetical protein
MINYQVFGLCYILDKIRIEETYRERMAQMGGSTTPLASSLEAMNASLFIISDEDKTRFSGMLQFATRCADQLELQAVHDRIETFQQKMRFPLSHVDCTAELRALREAFEAGIRYICFYHYPNDKSSLVKRVQGDWAIVLNKFEGMRSDIVAAVDCYALDHNSASVFHLMMIMEKAVQAFGRKLKVNLVKKYPGRRVSELTWEQILNELNPKLKAIPQSTVVQKRRHERLSAIQAHLYAVKDAWRNPTMHPRDTGYTAPQNLDLLNHVRTFMIGFAEVV